MIFIAFNKKCFIYKDIFSLPLPPITNIYIKMKENQEAARKFPNLFKFVGMALLALNVYWFCMEHDTSDKGMYAVLTRAWFSLLKGLDDGLYLLHSPYSTIVPALLVFFGASVGDKAVQTNEKKFFGRTYAPTHELGMKVAGAGLLVALASPIALLIPVAFPVLKLYNFLYVKSYKSYLTDLQQFPPVFF